MFGENTYFMKTDDNPRDRKRDKTEKHKRFPAQKIELNLV